jgi:mediator of RNA polymerase II transcription subunit 13
MWTNIFKIGELQTVSWYQFLPVEPDYNATSERSSKAEQKDALNSIVLSAYLHLQSEGLLSAWSNSFVGPWDPSQGEHNPDEKIKLWLFLSGRHSSVPEMIHPAVAKLRVVSSGLWVAPGNSEEVAAALCQALRSSLERALKGLSYARFGDVFTKYNPPTRNENSFRSVRTFICLFILRSLLASLYNLCSATDEMNLLSFTHTFSGHSRCASVAKIVHCNSSFAKIVHCNNSICDIEI